MFPTLFSTTVEVVRLALKEAIVYSTPGILEVTYTSPDSFATAFTLRLRVEFALMALAIASAVPFAFWAVAPTALAFCMAVAVVLYVRSATEPVVELVKVTFPDEFEPVANPVSVPDQVPFVTALPALTPAAFEANPAAISAPLIVPLAVRVSPPTEID